MFSNPRSTATIQGHTAHQTHDRRVGVRPGRCHARSFKVQFKDGASWRITQATMLSLDSQLSHDYFEALLLQYCRPCTIQQPYS